MTISKAKLWAETPSDPGRLVSDDPRLRMLFGELGFDDEWPARDLGGVMSLNLHLTSRRAVVRVHQPFESRARLLALRELRRHLQHAGLTVGAPQFLCGQELIRWEGRWVELEAFVPHRKPPPTSDSYAWMYGAMGALHRILREISVKLPRPTIATYGPPSTLRRWMRVTGRAVEASPRARGLFNWSETLLRRMAAQWVPTRSLPVQVIHGDIRLGNVAFADGERAAYFDFGFAASRPRIHEIAYTLAWVLLRPDGSGTGGDFDLERLPEFINCYEDAAQDRVSDIELQCVRTFVVSVPLYLVAVSGFTPNPSEHLLSNEPFVRIASWVLDHPQAFDCLLRNRR